MIEKKSVRHLLLFLVHLGILDPVYFRSTIQLYEPFDLGSFTYDFLNTCKATTQQIAKGEINFQRKKYAVLIVTSRTPLGDK